MTDKIIKELPIIQEYNNLPTENIGVFIDTETTGISNKDQIVEIAMVKFGFTDDFKITNVSYAFVGLQEPTIDFPVDVQKLTGITAEELVGKKILTDEVLDYLGDVDFVFSHKRSFDKHYFEEKFGKLDIPWLCTLEDINWSSHHFSSRSLDYLLYKFGYWYDAHRAEIDCRAGIHLLSQTFDDKTVLGELFENFLTPKVKIAFVNLPFNLKDEAKNLGCRWNSEEKFWFKEVSEKELEVERNKLSIIWNQIRIIT